VKVLFDTNVILDFLFDREPFSDPAAELFMLVQKNEIKGFLCATTITTIFYIASKIIGSKSAIKQIKRLLKLFDIAKVDGLILAAATISGFKDFEDAVLYESALSVQAHGIVTPNPGDFKKAKIQIYSPTELLYTLKSIEK